MHTPLTDDTKAIMLLCGVFGEDHAVDPLTQTEYNTLARWLFNQQMRPGDLLRQENWNAATIGASFGIRGERLKALLGRGVSLGFAVEEWQRNGIWVISRSDEDYPERYKRHLKDKAPPLIFGVGDRSQVQGGGVAIVGARNVDAEGEDFARKSATLCAHNKMPVVSGGARGVDWIAMTAALEAGGVTIGILADNLLKKSLDRDTRSPISEGRLLLLSPYPPNARFTAGAAIGRNKLIYALADYGLVVSADYKKGGTWTGATEELKRGNSLTIFIRTGENVPLGNKKMLELGAIEWPAVDAPDRLDQQLAEVAKSTERNSVEEKPALQMPLPLP
uniref:Predicted Rossmann fold nucleotide-binding protein DprA/Smf involved in DNA uptake n=1 Tax=Candidatus Kentrum sp. TUN TaxID=2126343 RepID=A0A450ZUH4_9GAMM|nr:MAG: Predicted Rossmann fold nucleotide-binding protein DprA/Smf involved in DNA uptake [Candidatus Kentron sp. TUN]VFK57388.1 MAG: Predicted Rossmann fold nucleotide-binding protein DprA/Smf involved in DNA uptake [Candidatus Kentron sp. TUN]